MISTKIHDANPKIMTLSDASEFLASWPASLKSVPNVNEEAEATGVYGSNSNTKAWWTWPRFRYLAHRLPSLSAFIDFTIPILGYGYTQVRNFSFAIISITKIILPSVYGLPRYPNHCCCLCLAHTLLPKLDGCVLNVVNGNVTDVTSVYHFSAQQKNLKKI